MVDERIGILMGSFVAGAAGYLFLRLTLAVKRNETKRCRMLSKKAFGSACGPHRPIDCKEKEKKCKRMTSNAK